VKSSIILAFLSIMVSLSFGQGQDMDEIEILADEIGKGSTFFGLIIGINNYQEETLHTLDNPVQDAENLYSTLNTSYNFQKENITLLKYATNAEIIVNLDELTKLLTPDDNLLIFYAGHGFWDMEAETGYWLPSDAGIDSKVNWFSTDKLLEYIRNISSRHTLLIVDASFSGSVFKARRIAFNRRDLRVLYGLPSRKAITSSNLNDPPEKSILTKYLVQRLNENKDTWLTSEQLFRSIRQAVISNSQGIPQYGTILGTGDQGGDFIFLKSN
jgi:hypothetical protein